MVFQITVTVDLVGGPDQMDGEPYHVYVARRREQIAREVRQTLAENNRLKIKTAGRPRLVNAVGRPRLAPRS
jgi:hypothetical protein